MNQEQAKLYTAILIACIVITAIILFFAISLIRHQRRALAFNRKNLLQEISTLEKDRSRMAADLHDELGPLLSQVKFRVNSLEVHDPEDQKQLETSSRQIDEVIERIRGIARNLMPGSLLKKGLHTALKEYLEGLNRNGFTELHFIDESKIQLDEEKSINIFRTIQEICQNTLKHASATHLLIKFFDKGNTLHIICEDNGQGFHYEKIYQENRGLGLRNLKSRVDIMGGKLQVKSVPGKGTQYAIEIPVHE